MEPDINLDFLDSLTLDTNETSTCFKKESKQSIKNVAKRIADTDKLFRKIHQLETEKSQWHELKKSADEVTQLYLHEKSEHMNWLRKYQEMEINYKTIESDLEEKNFLLEQLEAENNKQNIPTECIKLISKFIEFYNRINEQNSQIIELKDKFFIDRVYKFCVENNIKVEELKKPKKSRNKNKKKKNIENELFEKAIMKELTTSTPHTSVVMKKIETKDQNIQTEHINMCSRGTQSTIINYHTRGTTTTPLPKVRSIGTMHPETIPTEYVENILKEFEGWCIKNPISPIKNQIIDKSTCTSLYNVTRPIDYSDQQTTPIIKRSNSRPQSRLGYDILKYESIPISTDLLRTTTDEFTNFPTPNLMTQDLSNFNKLWHALGQLLQNLLQNRNENITMPANQNFEQFQSWVHHIYNESLQISNKCDERDDFQSTTNSNHKDVTKDTADNISQTLTTAMTSNSRLKPNKSKKKLSKSKKKLSKSKKKLSKSKKRTKMNNSVDPNVADQTLNCIADELSVGFNAIDQHSNCISDEPPVINTSVSFNATDQYSNCIADEPPVINTSVSFNATDQHSNCIADEPLVINTTVGLNATDQYSNCIADEPPEINSSNQNFYIE